MPRMRIGSRFLSRHGVPCVRINDWLLRRHAVPGMRINGGLLNRHRVRGMRVHRLRRLGTVAGMPLVLGQRRR